MPLITGMMSTPKSAANEKHVKTIEKSFLVLEQARKNRKKPAQIEDADAILANILHSH